MLRAIAQLLCDDEFAMSESDTGRRAMTSSDVKLNCFFILMPRNNVEEFRLRKVSLSEAFQLEFWLEIKCVLIAIMKFYALFIYWTSLCCRIFFNGAVYRRDCEENEYF